MTLTESPSLAAPPLPASLRLGAVHLTVTDLHRSVGFYQDALGLSLHRRDDRVAAMGAGGEDLVVLHEEPFARPADRHAGLYHYALLYPSRAELARAAVRLAVARTPIQGASDHGTHEAMYLADPDGNGVELAADRPRAEWPDFASDPYAGRPRPLALNALLGLVQGQEPTPRAERGLAMGHVHLHVGSIDRALAHYRDVLGFEVIFNLGEAAFVSAGGYHHHLGLNVWRGEGVPAEPPGTVGMRRWDAVLPSEDEVAAVRDRALAAGADVELLDAGVLVRDPWGIALLLRAE